MEGNANTVPLSWISARADAAGHGVSMRSLTLPLAAMGAALAFVLFGTQFAAPPPDPLPSFVVRSD